MKEAQSRRALLVAFIWLVIAGGLALAWRTFVKPEYDAKVVAETGSESRYRTKLRLSLDAFSGYAVLRSKEFRGALQADGIRLALQDDGADYTARLRALDQGEADMAVFTVDSLITASAAYGDLPATIVLVIDETRGADAVVTKPGGPKTLEDLDHPDARFVLTPSSPSEFLARVVRAHFKLDSMGKEWFLPRVGAEAVLQDFRKTQAGQPRAFVLWEPFVSQAVSEGGQVLLDSSKLKGLIVDVLVARRRFLLEQPQTVRQVAEAYLRSAHGWQEQADGFTKLVLQDSQGTSSPLSQAQAERLSQGVLWKNTLENYAHFGLVPRAEAAGVQHLEDVISNVVNVLVRTGALAKDPLDGKPANLFYSRVLQSMKDDHFHPGGLPGVTVDTGQRLEAIRPEKELAPLTEREWDALAPVGDVSVADLSFARGTARLNISSERELTNLGRILSSWPSYYVVVTGHARAQGDMDANRRLAQQRAQAAADFLESQGVARQRMRVLAAVPTGQGGRAQAVRFQLGQKPY